MSDEEEDKALIQAARRARQLKGGTTTAPVAGPTATAPVATATAPGATETATGAPVKRRRIGETGWIQVITSTGLTYYVDNTTRQTTWHCPKLVTEWLEKHAIEKERQKQLKAKSREAERKLTEEEQNHAYAVLIKTIMTDRKVPPVMTYDRAEPRLLLDPRFQDVPKANRESAFQKAKQLFLQGPTTSSIKQQFKDKVEHLKSTKKIRADHSVDEVLETYFSDSKWLAVKREMQSLIEDCIEEAQNRLQEELSEIAGDFFEVLKSRLQPYLLSQYGPVPNIEAFLRSFMSDNDKVLMFLDPKNIHKYQEYLRDTLKDKEAHIYSTFAAQASTDLVEELIGDAWQMFCQDIWAQLPPPQESQSERQESEPPSSQPVPSSQPPLSSEPAVPSSEPALSSQPVPSSEASEPAALSSDVAPLSENIDQSGFGLLAEYSSSDEDEPPLKKRHLPDT